MPERLPPSDADLRDLEILVRANHSLIVIETEEPERVRGLVRWVADRLGLASAAWSPRAGLARDDAPGASLGDTIDPVAALAHVGASDAQCLYLFEGLSSKLEDAGVAHALRDVALALSNRKAAVVLPLTVGELPSTLVRVATTVRLATPTAEEYRAFVRVLLDDLRERMPVRVSLTDDDVARLLQQLRGLTLFEVKKVLTKAIVEDGAFTADDIPTIAAAKREIIERTGVLEYFGADERMADVAGLFELKAWLSRRRPAFSEPERAKEFGLVAPRGVLLLGVQGCGKSLCAKAVAREWGLPLIRLDPSRLYAKYFGESEKNLRRATRTAEAMAPIVLWIDEIDKALAQGGGEDGGTSARIFGTFLAWMQEKKEGVFVVATANDIERLPPELLRKGRFDEIFFVDLPNTDVRRAILALHLARRGRDPTRFDLDALATATEGFSGAELEQAVISALYTAFARGTDVDTALVSQEIAATVPLSVTAREKIDALRAWAKDRTVAAG